jgi:hypothetical protein
MTNVEGRTLKAYSLGWKVVSTTGSASSVPLFRRALEIDPHFAMAFRLESTGMAWPSKKISLLKVGFTVVVQLPSALTTVVGVDVAGLNTTCPFGSA